LPDPAALIRNLAAKSFRRVAAVPKRGLRIVRRTERMREQAAAFHAEWRLEREIAAVARGRGPIIAGPWLSEVGFEALYWVPFIRWFEDRYRVNRDRVVAVSRGGVADWYSDVASRYVEIFDLVPPDEFARRNRERHQQNEAGGQKQTTMGAFDRELIAAACKASALDHVSVLHPSLMYRLFNRFWFGNRALDLVTSHTRFVPVTAGPPAFDLPDRYIAAKFYTGAALPGSVEDRAALRELVRTAASHLPVVMLDTGLATDEHEDYLFRDIDGVISLREQLRPSTNLGDQTRVMARASGFIGTCGSLAWLAPLLGVDTVAVYSESRFLLSHIFFATQIYRQAGAARFETLDLRAATDLDLFASAAAVSQEHHA
jgi:hypothetical protein